MSKLLRADFVRLFQSKIFWIGIFFSAGMGALSSVTQYREMQLYPDYTAHFDDRLFFICMFLPVVAAVFIGLFVGTDYSNGTIRNKLIVGRTRGSLYASNFIVCTTALFLMQAASFLAVGGIGSALVGNGTLSVKACVVLFLASMAATIALCAIFLFLSMLISSKANASVAAMVLSIALLMGATMIYARLIEPEYYDAYKISYTDENGQTQEEQREKTKNPSYLTGTKREVYEFLNDFLPGCQMLQISQQEVGNPAKLSLYSLSIAVVVTAGGLWCFRRKNIN